MFKLYGNASWQADFRTFDEVCEHFRDMLGERLDTFRRFQLRKGLRVLIGGTEYRLMREEMSSVAA